MPTLPVSASLGPLIHPHHHRLQMDFGSETSVSTPLAAVSMMDPSVTLPGLGPPSSTGGSTERKTASEVVIR